MSDFRLKALHYKVCADNANKLSKLYESLSVEYTSDRYNQKEVNKLKIKILNILNQLNFEVMKELTIEEKAQRYDEALKKAKNYHSPETVCNVRIAMENLFPELKESEDERKDERIRKDIIWCLKHSHIKENGPINPHVTTITRDAIAWLEKQGDKKFVVTFPKFRVGDEIKTVNEESLTITKIDEKGYWSDDLFICNFDEECLWDLVKQKPTDKVEVGDWVVENAHVSHKTKIYAFLGNGIVEFEDGTFETEENLLKGYHKWTIEDAKPGDVLSWDDSKCIALFKNIYDKESFNSYGFVGHCTGVFESRLSYHDIKGAHPATKEQRDLLFTKMKEAGYEWDAERKNRWKPSDEQVKAFEHFVRNVMGSSYGSFYKHKTNVLCSLLNDLKKL